MHEATVTIVKKSPPAVGKKMWKLDTETGELFLAFPSDAALFEVGGRYTLKYTSSDFGGATWHTVKGSPTKLLAGSMLVSSRPGEAMVVSPRAGDVGPHQAMWEKRISKLLAGGMAEEAIPLHVITCRRLAREGLKVDIDAKLPEPADDNLDDTF